MVPPVILFCLLVQDACHVVGTTCNDRQLLCNTFGWMGALQAPKQFHSRVLMELTPWKLQRICILRHLNLGLILPNNIWMVMHFFMCISVQSHGKIPKVQKTFNSQVSYQKKMYMFYSSGWIIFLQFKRQANQESQISAKIGPPHLSDCSKNVLFFTISWAQHHCCVSNYLISDLKDHFSAKIPDSASGQLLPV